MKFRELFVESKETFEFTTGEDLDQEIIGTASIKNKKKIEKLIKEFRKKYKNIDPDDYEDDYFEAYEDLMDEYMTKFEKISISVL